MLLPLVMYQHWKLTSVSAVPVSSLPGPGLSLSVPAVRRRCISPPFFLVDSLLLFSLLRSGATDQATWSEFRVQKSAGW